MSEDGAKETLKNVSEAKGLSIGDTIKDFKRFIGTNFPEVWAQVDGDLANIEEEDLDFFASSFSVNVLRPTGMGTGKGEKYVGAIVGLVDERDLMRRQREGAIEAAEINMSQALRYGLRINDKPIKIGRAYYESEHWVIVDANDKPVHRTPGKESEPPNWLISVPTGANIALLGQGNRPKTKKAVRREWLFVGNTQERFLTEGFRLLHLECSFEAATVDLKMNTPISFKAQEEAAWNDPDRTILTTSNIFPEYGLNWIPDDKLSKAETMFAPDQLLVNNLDVVDLEKAFDYHDANVKTTPSGYQIGPIFCLRGVVDYIDHDGKDAEYVMGGIRHAMTLFTQSLRRENANESRWIDISNHLKMKHHAFQVKKGNEWFDYTKGTRVFAIVRSRTWESTSGDINLSLDGLNIHAIPLYSIVASKPPPKTNDLSGLDGFSFDDDEDEPSSGPIIIEGGDE